jgi:thioredoxin reductase (NADPH)
MTSPLQDSPAARPVILIVEPNHHHRDRLVAALERRFGADYDIRATDAAGDGHVLLSELATSRAEVAAVAAALRLPDANGPGFLTAAHRLHPGAGSVLLLDMGEVAGMAEVHHVRARHRIDLVLFHGWESPEEWLYPQVQEVLTRWSLAHRPSHEHVRIVGEQWSPRCHTLRDLLTRNMVPFGFYDKDSTEGQRLLAGHGIDADACPVLITFDGEVLSNPTNAEVAAVLGVRTSPEPGPYDVAILGAGPAGLAAAVYAASEGLRTVVIEPEALGGQAGTSSMIRNYPGFADGISGSELTSRATQQAQLFGAQFVFANRAVRLGSQGTARIVTLADGSEVETRTVVVATGVHYRRLEIPALDRLVGMGVYYGAAMSEAAAVHGEHAVVIGGANSAGQAAIHLAKHAATLTILIRGASLAQGMSDYLVREIEATSNIMVRTRTRVVDGSGDDRLETLVVEGPRGELEALPVAGAFVLIGSEPHTEWLAGTLQRDNGGSLLTGPDVDAGGWPLDRAPFDLETSLPGVFAIGDVRHGAVKRVVSAVGDGGVAIGQAHRYLARLTRDRPTPR